MAFYLRDTEKPFQKKGIEAKPYMACGPVVGTILIVAEKDDVDLIAPARHGLDGSYQRMCRSVAARLLERADKPLLLIRNGNND